MSFFAIPCVPYISANEKASIDRLTAIKNIVIIFNLMVWLFTRMELHTIMFVETDELNKTERGDNVEMTIELIHPVAMEQGLTFAIREGGRTVGSGRVATVIE